MPVVHYQERRLFLRHLRRDNNVFFAIRTTTASAHESNGPFQARVAGGATKRNSIGHGPFPYHNGCWGVVWLGMAMGRLVTFKLASRGAGNPHATIDHAMRAKSE